MKANKSKVRTKRTPAKQPETPTPEQLRSVLKDFGKNPGRDGRGLRIYGQFEFVLIVDSTESPPTTAYLVPATEAISGGYTPCISMRYGNLEMKANPTPERGVFFMSKFIDLSWLPGEVTWVGTTKKWLSQFWNQNWPYDWREMTMDYLPPGNTFMIRRAFQTPSGYIFDREDIWAAQHKSSVPAYIMIMLMHSFWKKHETGLDSRWAYVSGIRYLEFPPHLSLPGFDPIPAGVSSATRARWALPIEYIFKTSPALTMGNTAENFKNYERNAACVILAEDQ